MYYIKVYISHYGNAFIYKRFHFHKLGNVFVKLKGFKRNTFRLDVLVRNNRGRHGRDRMVDEFTTTYAISVYRH